MIQVTAVEPTRLFLLLLLCLSGELSLLEVSYTQPTALYGSCGLTCFLTWKSPTADREILLPLAFEVNPACQNVLSSISCFSPKENTGERNRITK